MQGLTIGELSRTAGISPKTIRFYEDKGLLPRARRSDSGYRLYGESDVRRLRLLREARALGFSLTEARDLAQRAMEQSCANFQHGLATDLNRRLAAVDRMLAELTQVRSALTDLQRRLSQEPCGDCLEPALQCCTGLDCSGA